MVQGEDTGQNMTDVYEPCVCVCVFSSHSFWTSSSLDVPAGVTQDFPSTFFLRCNNSTVVLLYF